MAAPTDYYVNVTGSDVTGNGTLAQPWATHHKALNTIVRNSTNGDKIIITGDIIATGTINDNIKKYGTPTAVAPLIFQGSGDGGIDGSGIYSITGPYNNLSYISYVGLKLHNCGNNNIVEVEKGSIINCEVYDNQINSNKYGIYHRSFGCVENCYIHDVSAGMYMNNDDMAINNYISLRNTDDGARNGIMGQNYACHILFNICLVNDGERGIYHPVDTAVIANNTVLSTGDAHTGIGIYVQCSQTRMGKSVYNNIIEGFSGAYSDGIRVAENTSHASLVVSSNSVFNCTTPFGNLSLGDWVYDDSATNEVLTKSPLAKRGEMTFENRYNYFQPIGGSGVIMGGWPTNSNMFRGAIAPRMIGKRLQLRNI